MRRVLFAKSRLPEGAKAGTVKHVATVRPDHERGRPPKRTTSALEKPTNLSDMAVLRNIFDGRRVLVLGSAPLAEPVKLLRDEVTVVVNGAVSSLPNVVPDVWFVNSRIKPLDRWGHERRFLHKTMMAQAAHRHIRTIAFMTRMETAEQFTAAWLRDQFTTYDRSVVVTRHDRERMEIEAGVRTQVMRKDACSAGVFAAIAALWGGASQVRMLGFSFERGYNYLPGHNLPENCRAHVQGDRLALRAIANKYQGRVSCSLFKAA